MPELPEVETIVRDLKNTIIGRKILDVTVQDGRVVRQKSEALFIKRLKGQTILDVFRRGKAIILALHPSQNKWVVQLMMTGQLMICEQGDPQRDTKVTFQLSKDLWLHYNDYRTFGRLQVVRDLSEIPYFSRLGPEPLTSDFTLDWLKKALLKYSVPIKPLLLNHQFVAGIGNIYASEILYASRIHPLRSAKNLKEPEVQRLHKEIQNILQSAVQSRGTSMNTYRDAKGQKGEFMNRIKVYDKEHEPCESCQTPLVRTFQAGRSTFYCESCQK